MRDLNGLVSTVRLRLHCGQNDYSPRDGLRQRGGPLQAVVCSPDGLPRLPIAGLIVSRYNPSNETLFYLRRLLAHLDEVKFPVESAIMDQATAQAVNLMVQRLIERFAPQQIILFGSHARGTAVPGSDVDLLVIMPVTGSKRAKQVEMRVALHDIAVPKDIILVTPEEVERRRDVVGTLIRPALREGKVLYASSQ